VEECSHTLEHIEIACDFLGTSSRYPLRPGDLFLILAGCGPGSIDLSKAIKLKHSAFRVESRQVDWVTSALRTITPKHRDFRQITIYLAHDPTLWNVGTNVRQIVGELVFGQWLELDRLLAKLWESRSIRPQILYFAPLGNGKRITTRMGCLLPEITKRRIIDLDEWIF